MMVEKPESTLSEIERLEKQIEQKKALLSQKKKRLAEKEKKEARAKETRRKILAGAVVLQRAQRDGDFAGRLWAIIAEDLTEERNRVLFPELQKPQP